MPSSHCTSSLTGNEHVRLRNLVGCKNSSGCDTSDIRLLASKSLWKMKQWGRHRGPFILEQGGSNKEGDGGIEDVQVLCHGVSSNASQSDDADSKGTIICEGQNASPALRGRKHL